MDSDLSAAVALARHAVGAAADVPARATRVRRLDRDATYVLVDLGTPGTAGWVAAVDPLHDDVMAWAVNASGDDTVPTAPDDGTRDDTARDTTAPDTTASEAVWWAGGPSRSPLYPLLRVPTADGDRFMDLEGRLHPGGPAGRG